MDKPEALHRLREGNPRERLEAARALRRQASAVDAEAIAGALRREEVSWIRAALEDVLSRVGYLQSVLPPESRRLHFEPEHDAVYAAAIEETTGRLIHELKPIAGAIRLHVQLAVQEAEREAIDKELDRLDLMLAAIETLGMAASAPRWDEFDLSELVFELVEYASLENGPTVERAGPETLIVIGDRALLAVALRSGLTNAIDATLALEGERMPPITIAWDATDLDYWIAVLDRGKGLPPRTDRIFEIGATTKPKHQGMGLTLARRAMLSLGGSVELAPRDGGGVRYEMRWPRLRVE